MVLKLGWSNASHWGVTGLLCDYEESFNIGWSCRPLIWVLIINFQVCSHKFNPIHRSWYLQSSCVKVVVFTSHPSAKTFRNMPWEYVSSGSYLVMQRTIIVRVNQLFNGWLNFLVSCTKLPKDMSKGFIPQPISSTLLVNINVELTLIMEIAYAN